jgi:hypothetical protein
MAILESIGIFILSLFCLRSCYRIQDTYKYQENEILRLERQPPPRYVEDIAPPYTNANTNTNINEIDANANANANANEMDIDANANANEMDIDTNEMDIDEYTPILPPPIDPPQY